MEYARAGWGYAGGGSGISVCVGGGRGVKCNKRGWVIGSGCWGVFVKFRSIRNLILVRGLSGFVA